MNTYELAPNAGRVINSLRDAGYSFNTAIADIVDNSISAGATVVSIWAGCDRRDGKINVSIADNGSGMTKDEVLNAMRYGSDERADAHSLGKFGLGLKTASTSQCRRVSVLSKKGKRGDIFKLILDIDHAIATNRWEYLEDTPTDKELDLFSRAFPDRSGIGSGTMVRWEKCDRILTRKYKDPGGSVQQNALEKKLDDLAFHLGIVFQRFLDEKDPRAPYVDIQLNGKKIKYWDPFCRDLPATIEVSSDDYPIEVDAEQVLPLHVGAYVVPNRDELTIEQMKKVFPPMKSPDSLQGIYIYRENRLIHWGDWCGLWKTEFHQRLCRIDLSFDSRLDSFFNVDFKKSRINIDRSIAEALLTKIIAPARDLADKRYRRSEVVEVKRQSTSIHENADADISRRAFDSREYYVRPVNQNRTEITPKRSRSTYIETLPVITSDKDSAIFPVPSLPDDVLWRPRIVRSSESGCISGVEINISHPYYQRAYSLCKNDPNAIKALDYLLWAIANAEYSSKDERSKKNFEELRRGVSRSLRNLSDEFPEVDLG